jgi:hypothetical protein
MSTSRETLLEALHSWRVTPSPDPNFRQAVWRRIAKPEGSTWPAYLRAHAATLLLASVFALGAAAYSGGAIARSKVRTERDAIVVTYLVDLDPRIQAALKP